MKQLLFAFACMALIISCDNSKVAGANEGGDHTALAERNAENMKTVYRAIETGDTKALDTLFAEDAIDHNGGPQGQDIKGRDSVIAMLGQIHTYFDNLKIEMLHYATSPDGQYVYATGRMTGKAKQNPWGIPVGMDMDDTSVDVVKLRDGKAVEHWGFMSMQDFNEIMGSMSGNQKPPAAKDSTQR